MHFVYILHSKKLNRFYIGETTNVEKRLEFHCESPPHKFTAKAKDWQLYLVLECRCKKQAKSIEVHIKRMKSKKYIQNLKKYDEMGEKLLLRYVGDC